jgi:hypothetical protein
MQSLQQQLLQEPQPGEPQQWLKELQKLQTRVELREL